MSVTINDIPTWHPDSKGHNSAGNALSYDSRPSLNNLISLWKGDINSLQIDAIVKASDTSTSDTSAGAAREGIYVHVHT